MTVATRPHTNGHAKTGGPRRLISVQRNALVGDLMDLQALAEEAVTANGYSLQTVMRLPAGPWRQEMQVAHIATHDALVKMLVELRMAAGRYDGLTAT